MINNGDSLLYHACDIKLRSNDGDSLLYLKFHDVTCYSKFIILTSTNDFMILLFYDIKLRINDGDSLLYLKVL